MLVRILTLSFLDGYRTMLGALGKMLVGLGQVAGAVSGSTDLMNLITQVSPAIDDISTGFLGLGIAGKIVKSQR